MTNINTVLRIRQWTESQKRHRLDENNRLTGTLMETYRKIDAIGNERPGLEASIDRALAKPRIEWTHHEMAEVGFLIQHKDRRDNMEIELESKQDEISKQRDELQDHVIRLHSLLCTCDRILAASVRPN